MPSLDDSDDDPHRQATLVLSRSIGQKKSGALATRATGQEAAGTCTRISAPLWMPLVANQ
jgi:hypothetical protein